MNAIDLLAKCHQANGDFKSAAYALASFKFEDYRGKCNATSERRIAWYVDTADFWLGVNETGSASQAIKKAHGIITEIKNNPTLILRFKTCYARVLDAERKFLEASLRYMELSQTANGLIAEADLIQVEHMHVEIAKHILLSSFTAVPSFFHLLRLLHMLP